MSQSAPVLLWFRQDLRLDDNAALLAAAATDRPVLPVFVLEDVGDWRWGGASRWWLHRSLAALDADLRRLGAPLVLRRGDPRRVLPELAAEDPRGDEGLLLARVVELVGPADVLELGPLELGQDRREGGRPRAGEGVEVVRLRLARGDAEVEVVGQGGEAPLGQGFEGAAFGWLGHGVLGGWCGVVGARERPRARRGTGARALVHIADQLGTLEPPAVREPWSSASHASLWLCSPRPE